MLGGRRMKTSEQQLNERVETTSRITRNWCDLSSHNEAFGVTVLLNQLAIMEVLQKLLTEQKNEI